MERALAAYTDGHIDRYFEAVKKEGLSEHGFPRLTANIGILIANGRRLDLLPRFIEMMEFCCRTIPKVKAANDFSVREIVACITAIEERGVIPTADTERWKDYLRGIKPEECYNVFATSPTDKLKNWALFTALSEFFRMKCGLGGSAEFIDTQLATQLQWLDENGMYMDGKGDTHHPIMYDLVPRGLFAILLDAGYNGKYYKEIDDGIKKAALMTLSMQSPNGEMAFGGRSNQFLHNEPWMICVYEYEAKRYKREGNDSLAREFRAAARRALKVTEEWLSLDPILHIKNRYPTKTRHGCEEYAYFDKYMITAASNLYAAYLVADDTIPAEDIPDTKPSVFATSYHFGKLFCKAGGYGIELDLNGDQHYDASGLGRVHRVGAPSVICMSCPCPGEPVIHLEIDTPMALSLCPGVLSDGVWRFGASDAEYTLLNSKAEKNSATVTVATDISGKRVVADYTVTGEGVKILASGEGKIGFMLPAFSFDGAENAEITLKERCLEIAYKGWICRYTSSGDISDLGFDAANRNGIYRAYYSYVSDALEINIEIVKE